MRAEYCYFVNNKFSEAVALLRQLIESNTNRYRNYPLRSLQEICKKQDALQIYNSIVKSCKDIGEEESFDIEES